MSDTHEGTVTAADFEDLAKAYATASSAADHFRAAVCAWFGLAVRPSDADLIEMLNWETAARRSERR